MASRSYREPVSCLLPETGLWPGGPFVSDAPVYAVETARLVGRLIAAMSSRPVRAVARDAGLDHATLLRLLAGTTIPDLATIVALEDALGVLLWRENL